MVRKAAEAFRTITEVADELDVPKHVLRFWEIKFPQIRPMKRGGGRRYYRPEDMELLRGIRQLLQAEGYTIKGVQKILREQGVETAKMIGREVLDGDRAGEAPATAASVPSRLIEEPAPPRQAPAGPSKADPRTAERDSARVPARVRGASTGRAAAPQLEPAARPEAATGIGELRAVVVKALRELQACRDALTANGAAGGEPRLISSGP